MASLRPLDACFLEIEEADDTANLAIAAVAILEGPAPTRSEFAAAVGGRLGEVPRAQQVVRRMPLDLALPKWVAAEGFDVDRQVRRIALPHPGDDAELCRQIADIMAVRLDRDRPLWECWVVEGLMDGRWALLMKLHHSMADGISGTRLFESLCDPVEQPDADESPVPSRQGGSGTGTTVSRPVGLASWIVGALTSPRRTGARLVDLVSGSAVLAGRVLVPSSSSSFNGPLTRNRRYGVVRASLPEALEICHAFGVTLNDVALAAVSGAVRGQLIRRGEVPGSRTIRSLVPVSYRAGGAAGSALDNEISLMLPYLPVEVDDPVERLRVVHSRMQAAKSDGESGAGQVVTDLTRWLPFAPLALAVRAMLRVPQHSVALVTTDVPGPRVPLTLLGRRVVELLPYVPIAVRLRLGVAVMSYDQQLAFGVTGDYDGVPDLDELCEGIESDLDELHKAARGVPVGSSSRPEARVVAAGHEFRAVIVDLDGVVTDTAALHRRAWKSLFDGYLARLDPAQSPFTEEDYQSWVDGRSPADGIRAFLTSRDLLVEEGGAPAAPGESVSRLAERKDRLFHDLLDREGVQVIAPTVALLRRLRRSGVPVAAVSQSRDAAKVLGRAGLIDDFDVRVDGVDAQRLGLTGRSDPALFLEAAGRIRIDPAEIVVIEYAESGVDAAHRGGFGLVVGIGSDERATSLKRLGADVVVTGVDSMAWTICEAST